MLCQLDGFTCYRPFKLDQSMGPNDQLVSLGLLNCLPSGESEKDQTGEDNQLEKMLYLSICPSLDIGFHAFLCGHFTPAYFF